MLLFLSVFSLFLIRLLSTVLRYLVAAFNFALNISLKILLKSEVVTKIEWSGNFYCNILNFHIAINQFFLINSLVVLAYMALTF